MKKTVILVLTLILLLGVLTAPTAFALGEPWEEIGTLPQVVQIAQAIDTACDAAGNLYVADMYYDRIMRYTPDGVLDTSWGGDGIVGGVNGSGLNDFDLIRT